LIEANREKGNVQLMCDHFQVSRAGYYAWGKRKPSARAVKDIELRVKINALFEEHRGRYGSPRIHRRLRQLGVRIGRKRVARLMRVEGLVGNAMKYRNPAKAASLAYSRSIPNRAQYEAVGRLDQVWVADITYLKVNGKWRYLAVIMDKYSRRVLSWALGKHRNVDLTLLALRRARKFRWHLKGMVLHTDRGSEYGAEKMKRVLKRAGIVQSMNRPRQMNDNAHMESFFHSFKAETEISRNFASEEVLADEIKRYLKYYNQQRLHSSLKYLTPMEFEKRKN
jgi:putative transposase